MDWRARRWMVTTCMCYCCHCRSFVDNNSLSSARMKSTSLVCLSRSFIRYFMSTSKSIRYLLHISLIIQAIWREKKERERKRRTTTRYLHQKLKIWFISHAHTHTYALHSCIKTCWNDMVFTNFRTATYRNWTFLLFTSGDQLVSQHFFCTAILVDCHFWWHVVLFFLSLSLSSLLLLNVAEAVAIAPLQIAIVIYWWCVWILHCTAAVAAAAALTSTTDNMRVNIYVLSLTVQMHLGLSTYKRSDTALASYKNRHNVDERVMPPFKCAIENKTDLWIPCRVPHPSK